MRRPPAPVVTYAIITANVAVFAWMLVRGVPFLSPGVGDLLEFGADNPPLVVSGEWWRLFACMFVHAGVVHVALNMWALRVLGPPVEMLFGRWPFAIMYILCGWGGSVASCLWHPAGVSVGASGAIFGLPGVIVAFFVMHRSQLPPGLFRAQMRSMATFLGINLLIGLSIPQIDLAGHAGGLVTGFACGIAGYRSVRSAAAITQAQLLKFALVAVVLAAMIPLIRARVLDDQDAAHEFWWIRGDRAQDAGRFEDVHAIGQSAVESDPEWAHGYELRASAALQGPDPDRARADLDRALQLDPSSARTWMMRAWLRARAGDHKGASEDFERATELGDIDVLGLWFRGRTRHALELWAPALRDFESEIELHGASASEAQLYAWSCREHLGMPEVATRELESALAAGRLGSGWERDVAEYLTGRISDAEFAQRMDATRSSARALLWSREKSAATGAKASAR